MRILLIILLAVGIYYCVKHPITATKGGVSAPELPRQSEANLTPFQSMGLTVTPLASLDMTARVLSTQTYSGDMQSTYSATDVVFGWGPLSNTAIYNTANITQSAHNYTITPGADFPKDQVSQIGHYSANVHLIPSNEELKTTIASLRKDMTVHIKGQLVQLSDGSGWTWKSSLSRDDTGPDASELMWVESLEILN